MQELTDEMKRYYSAEALKLSRDSALKMGRFTKMTMQAALSRLSLSITEIGKSSRKKALQAATIAALRQAVFTIETLHDEVKELRRESQQTPGRPQAGTLEWRRSTTLVPLLRTERYPGPEEPESQIGITADFAHRQVPTFSSILGAAGAVRGPIRLAQDAGAGSLARGRQDVHGGPVGDGDRPEQAPVEQAGAVPESASLSRGGAPLGPFAKPPLFRSLPDIFQRRGDVPVQLRGIEVIFHNRGDSLDPLCQFWTLGIKGTYHEPAVELQVGAYIKGIENLGPIELQALALKLIVLVMRDPQKYHLTHRLVNNGLVERSELEHI